MPSIGARGPSREGYLKMRGPNLRLENTSLHREDFVRVDKLHATSTKHDSDRAIFLRREVDRPPDRRIRNTLSADLVVKTDLREDLRILLARSASASISSDVKVTRCFRRITTTSAPVQAI